MGPKIHGTVDGVPITDDVIDRLVSNAEAGFPGVKARRAPGRPALGEGPATTVAVRLDPDLHRALIERTETAGSSASEVIRQALRNYLDAA
jgi:uncharacterized protein (DUF4415 family)